MEPSPTASSLPNKALSLRIITLDYYMAHPDPELDVCYSSLLGQPVSEVPVVRIFGTTITGQKMCLHLHKVFPYFYIPYDDDLPQDIGSASSFARCLAFAMEKAMKLASNVGAKRQHIYNCSLVRGKKFYGFHSEEQLFVKITLYYPQEVQRLSTLLLSGGILNRQFQPHESHIPFLLQIMIDYNLSGMGHIHLSDVKYRLPVLENRFVPISKNRYNFCSMASVLGQLTSTEGLSASSQGISTQMELWCNTVDTGQQLQATYAAKQSTCELEGDASVEAILNHHELLYTSLEEAGPDVKMVQSLIPIVEELSITSNTTNIGKVNTATSRHYIGDSSHQLEFGRVLDKIIYLYEHSHIYQSGQAINRDNQKSRCTQEDSRSLPERDALLSCTQAAYSKDRKEEDSKSHLSVSKDTTDIDEATSFLNEDIIRHQLTQNSQDTDDEAVDLLRWMISSQKEEDVIAEQSSDDETKDDEPSWSQVFQCADEALAKAISDYELYSQQECQDIIESLQEDSVRREAGAVQCQEKTNDHSEMSLCGTTGDDSHYIPQLDGSADEKHCVPDSTRKKHISDSPQQEVKTSTVQHEQSLRDLMRLKRMGRQGNALSSEKPSLVVHVASVEEDLVRSKRFCSESDLAHISTLEENMSPKKESTECPSSEVHERHKHHTPRKIELSDQISRFAPLPLVKMAVSTDKPQLASVICLGSQDPQMPSDSRTEGANEGNGRAMGVTNDKSGLLEDKVKEKYHPQATSSRCLDGLSQEQRIPVDSRVLACLELETNVVNERDMDVGNDHSEPLPSVKMDVGNDLSEPLPSVKMDVDNDDSGSTPFAKMEINNNHSSRHLEETEVEKHHSNVGISGIDNFSQEQEMLSDYRASPFVKLDDKTIENANEGIENARDGDMLDASLGSEDINVAGFVQETKLIFTSGLERDMTQNLRVNTYTREDIPYVLTFKEKPPSTEHLLATFGVYDLPVADHGNVFYGRSEDLPDQPSVIAGMVFEVMSKDVEHLPPYQFSQNTRSVYLTRTYMSSTAWTPTMEDNDTIVLPSHFQNDGSVRFLLSPVKSPPTLHEVSSWLRQFPKSQLLESAAVDQQGVDCSQSSQDSWNGTQDSSQASEVLRPSSPKYDENLISSYFSEKGSTPASQRVKPETTPGSQRVKPETTPVSQPKQSSDFVRQVFEVQPSRTREDISQISGPTAAENHFTPASQTGFRDPASSGHGQQITVMSIEVFAGTRGNLRPDPRYDMINCITLVLQDDSDDQQGPAKRTIVLLYDPKDVEASKNNDGVANCEVLKMKDEISLLRMFIWVVKIYDPDILVGWETQGFSLGLLAERAANLGIGLLREVSRLPLCGLMSPMQNMTSGENSLVARARIEAGIADVGAGDDEWGRTHGSGMHVSGRIVLNLWRIMRGEVKLGNYTLEAVAQGVLKRKVPLISWRTLTQWFASGAGKKRHLCIEHYIDKAKVNLQIIDQLDLINRNSELARVFGIDFFSVLSRGSQYRVESMMLRIAHSQNYLLISPSRQQVASQPAMQCLPLVMEPESRFYTDPVVVLDFQSLYPSMVIGYNLCYSTCLGKIVPDNPKVLGVTTLELEHNTLRNIKDGLTFTPNGVMFASPKIRPGILPRLLDEILSTRIMVKQAMKKLLPTQKVLQRVLNARQMALKLIANVTYGYTAAGFSGRMPCAEIADSIVQSGRFTLESAIDVVNNNKQWNARVVYGDTDSMFVLLKGRTKEEAFRIGEDIAATITSLNPHPVTLKMEKVYHPCVLLTKKRYAGYSYESPNQVAPIFDAKGIETVRRDSCAAVSKTLEKSLRILFETHDISQVKAYLQRQWGKILSGRISLKDFIFAKEVRLGTYSTRTSVLPPAAIVATKAMSVDPRAEPRYGERIPHVVVHGEPGARLVDLVVDPYAVLDINSSYQLHTTYYITKQIIPALQRVFGLVGVDMNSWYNDMPRLFRPAVTKRPFTIPTAARLKKSLIHGTDVDIQDIMDGGQSKISNKRSTIDHYYLSQHCLVCGELIQAKSLVCGSCSANQTVVAVTLLGRASRLERDFKHIQAICSHCGGGDLKDIEEGLGCISLDCSVFFERIKLQKEYRAAVAFTNQYGL